MAPKGADKKTSAKASVAKKVAKAVESKKKVVKGQKVLHKKKVRTSVHFRRPKTLKVARNPK